MTRGRILACAFTCCPPAMPGFTGGEDVLGWSLLQQIARFHDVWAITHAEDRQSIEQTLSKRPVPGLHIHYVGLPQWLKPLLKYQGGHQFYYYLWQLKAYLKARRLQRQNGFDLFHHITYANDWMASFIGAFAPIPYVRGPGGGAHRTPKGLSHEYTLGGRFWEKLRTIGQWVFRHDPVYLKGQSRASALLLCNRDSIAKNPKEWSHKAHLFPVSGVSSEDLARTPSITPNHNQFSALSAGSLIKVKGFGLAIKAFEKFSKNHPDSMLTIAGSGPEETRLRRLIDRYQLSEKVQVIGAIPRDELLTRMESSDVLLFPSLRDGGGTVVIEAMSLGKPVVCLDIGGPGMHITDECGIKITPSSQEETVRDLADALELLYSDKELRFTMGQAAREKAKRDYHWDHLGDRLAEIYQAIIGNELPNDACLISSSPSLPSE
ncbi:glycosyltransferase family 4 protein [SAR202 cluster bacterium AD-802-F09_MRT_200m]|nr:glycosyltransferase family 4 protein [SAR202 cluster bacterium AD-802-F09_MRT_200m]